MHTRQTLLIAVDCISCVKKCYIYIGYCGKYGAVVCLCYGKYGVVDDIGCGKDDTVGCIVCWKMWWCSLYWLWKNGGVGCIGYCGKCGAVSCVGCGK